MVPTSLTPIDRPYNRPAAGVVLFIALLLLGYTVVRSICVSFTIDETFTFVNHVKRGILYQRTFDQMSANHHLLNVWGMWASMKLFGTSELALRLPNVLAHALYLYASARIALKAGNALVAIACFLLLNVHPYLLDFFGTARGYGLACGLMMMSLWQVVRYMDEGQRVESVRRATLFAGLATLAHLVMLNYLFALALAFMLTWSFQARRTGLRSWRKHLLVMMAGVAITLLIVVPIVLGMRKSGSLYYGCDLFLSCTVRSFGEKVLYHIPYKLPALTLMGVISVAIVLWCTSTYVVARRQKWTDRLGPFTFGLLLLGGWSLSVALQHVFFDVPLPQTRTALFAIPLLAFLVVSCSIAWPAGRGSMIPKTANLLFCVPLLIHQKNSSNSTYTVEWKPSGEIAHMMDLISRDHRPLSPDLPVITVGSSYESYGCIPYYRHVRNMRWLTTTPRQARERYAPSDYYIVEYDGYDAVDTANWSLVYLSEITNTTLYRDERLREARPDLIHLASMDMESPGIKGTSTLQHHSGQHSLRFDGTTREMKPLRWIVPADRDSGSFTFSANAEVLQEEDDNFIALVISVIRDGRELTYSYTRSSEQIVTFGQWGHVGAVFRPTIPLLPGDIVQLRAWPLSPNSVMYLDDLELRILQ